MPPTRTDGAPSSEVLTPSNGAWLPFDACVLIEASVRVGNITLKALVQCGTDVGCGHAHLDLDGVSCRQSGFYDEWIIQADADGFAEAVVDTQYGVEPCCIDS